MFLAIFEKRAEFSAFCANHRIHHQRSMEASFYVADGRTLGHKVFAVPERLADPPILGGLSAIRK